jgi:hypothetical protein
VWQNSSGVRGLKWTGVGLVAGAVTSVLPAEVFLISPVILVVALSVAVSRARRERNHRLVLPVAVVFCVAVLVAAAATLVPLKFVDRTHLEGISANCVTLREVATASRTRVDALDEEALGRTVCFTSTRPSMREVFAAVEKQLGLSMRYLYCGNGATLLFGAYPMGDPRLGHR